MGLLSSESSLKSNISANVLKREVKGAFNMKLLFPDLPSNKLKAEFSASNLKMPWGIFRLEAENSVFNILVGRSGKSSLLSNASFTSRFNMFAYVFDFKGDSDDSNPTVPHYLVCNLKNVTVSISPLGISSLHRTHVITRVGGWAPEQLVCSHVICPNFHSESGSFWVLLISFALFFRQILTSSELQ